MKIDRKTLLLKLHYFMFAGSQSPIGAFMYVFGMQLGASVSAISILDSLILVLSTVMKPIMSIIVDAFPRLRRPLLIAVTSVTCVTLAFLAMIPDFKAAPRFTPVWMARDASNETFWSVDAGSDSSGTNTTQKFYYGEVNMSFTQDCRERYEQNNVSEQVSVPWSQLRAILPLNSSCELQSGRDCRYAEGGTFLQLKLLNSSLSLSQASYSISTREGARARCADMASLDSLECVAGTWNNSDCGGSIFHSSAFWYFVILLVAREMAYSTTNSFSDAIAIETVGEEGNFGSQQLWQVLNRMLLAPASSVLVDWFSGDRDTKNYTPAFVLATVFGVFDVIVCFFLKVPQPKRNESVWSETKLLMSKYQFVLFLFFTLMNGVLVAVPWMFILVVQEKLAAGTPVMKHLKLVQGLTVFIRNVSQLPWSYYADSLVRRFGAGRLTTAVFGAHVLRLVLLAVTAKWGPVWSTAIVEVLVGPVYGLGYPLVVLYARQFTPPGLTNTVQSLANNAFDNLCFALGGAIGGQMIENLGGVKTFLIFAAVGVVTSALHALFDFYQPRGNEDPEAPRDTSMEAVGAATSQASAK